jgi:hypothetical protein
MLAKDVLIEARDAAREGRKPRYTTTPTLVALELYAKGFITKAEADLIIDQRDFENGTIGMIAQAVAGGVLA